MYVMKILNIFLKLKRKKKTKNCVKNRDKPTKRTGSTDRRQNKQHRPHTMDQTKERKEREKKPTVLRV